MRLLTRSDYDGLLSAVILKEKNMYDEIQFVHPKDIQDGLVAVDKNDVLVNIPFVPGCGWWFDHHISEYVRGAFQGHDFQGMSRPAKSCARVVFDYFGGMAKMPHFAEMVDAADKCDSASFSIEDVVTPSRWVLLSFIMDPRTGLGRYRDYRISNYQLMELLIDELRTKTVDEILTLQDVTERTGRYFEHEKSFKEMLSGSSRVEGDAAVTDLRGTEETYVGTRHMIYALFPEANIDVRMFDGKNKEKCIFAVGYSVINRTACVDVGALMLRHGGGGHKAVGTCQVPYEKADEVLDDILNTINNS